MTAATPFVTYGRVEIDGEPFIAVIYDNRNEDAVSGADMLFPCGGTEWGLCQPPEPCHFPNCECPGP